jgi:hypothetical protein
MKHTNKFTFYIILAILFILFIICFNNKTIEGLTSTVYPINFCSIVTQQDVCQTSWPTRGYFTNNPSKLIKNQNPCSWNVNTQYPNGICQNSTSASAWGFSFTGPELT